MATKFTKFDAAEYLDSPEMIAEYLNAAFETKDLAFIKKAIGEVARARGMGKLAAATGLAREGLYKSLSAEGNPAFDTIQQAIGSFGLKLTVEPDDSAEAA